MTYIGYMYDPFSKLIIRYARNILKSSPSLPIKPVAQIFGWYTVMISIIVDLLSDKNIEFGEYLVLKIKQKMK